MNQAIRLQNITKKFNDFTAVDHLNLEVNKGDIYGFLGPNGSGKSTTLRMIMGLIKPSEGNVELFGLSLQDHRSEIMKKVGCIIEKPDFYNYLSAHENLQLFARACQLKLNENQYKEHYEMVGLYGRQHDKVKTYSHGMKQRLGLAQALLHQPDMIILDEPNTGLDPQGILDLRKLIFQLNKERNLTVLFSSHILSEVQELCNSIIVIHKGKTIAQGNVQELISAETLHVSVEVGETSVTACEQFLQQSAWQHKLHKGSTNKLNVIFLKMSSREIPLLVRELTGQGIDILRLDFKNQLEEYFLKITHS